MKAKQTGFSLLELMIAVAIVGLLTAVAYPSYQSHIQKAKRSETEATLVSIATAMEQWRVENNNSYLTATIGTGATTDIYPYLYQPTDCSADACATYKLSFTALATGSYTLKAEAKNAQTSDGCVDLTLDSTGAKTPTTAGCWD